MTVQYTDPFKIIILVSIHVWMYWNEANEVSVSVAPCYRIIFVFGGQAVGKLHLVTHSLTHRVTVLLIHLAQCRSVHKAMRIIF